jgi:hypothetical protein
MSSARRYFYFCAHEQFPPDDLLRQAVLMNASGADPHGALSTYGERVLPSLRGARIA